MAIFSAAELVKKSTAQIWYKRKHPEEKKPSDRQLKGNEVAESKAISPFQEVGNYFPENLTKSRIYYSIDEVRLSKHGLYLIEHKMVDDPNNCPEWFLQSALIQTAFNSSMAMFVEHLRTAKFVKGDKYQLNISGLKVRPRLLFGDTWYYVSCDERAVIRFYLTKARASLEYETAKRFDNTYKQKEWELYFKNLINFRKCEAPKHDPVWVDRIGFVASINDKAVPDFTQLRIVNNEQK